MKKQASLLQIAVTYVIGILLCFSVLNPDSLINWSISITAIAAGAIAIVFSFATTRSLHLGVGGTGCLSLAIGIFFLPSLDGGQNILWMNGISMLMMVYGAAFIVDCVIDLILKKRQSRAWVLGLVGAVSFTIGICLWLIDAFRSFAGLMLGIAMIVYATLSLISLVTAKDMGVIDISDRDE